MDLTETEDIKKRWQENIEELCKKDLRDPDNHDGVITHLEPDILECEIKWALESIATNKASVLRSFNGPEPGGPESTNKKVKESERGWYSLVYPESQ